MVTTFRTPNCPDVIVRENRFAPRPLYCLISTHVIRVRSADNDIPSTRAYALGVRKNVERMGSRGNGKRHVREILIVSPRRRVGTRVIRADSCAAEMALGLRRREDKSSNGARDFWLPTSIRTRLSRYARETRTDTQIESIFFL